MIRLNEDFDAARASALIRGPRYDAQAHGTGIVHLGLGAFHRAHQAVYTDDALARAGGDWRICGVSLRSTKIVDALNAQDGRYCLTIRKQNGEAPDRRVIASIAHALAAARGVEPVLAILADPVVRIVSTTVTERGYGFDRASGTIDRQDPVIARDLAAPHAPQGVIGLLVEGLRRRKAAGLGPVTVLCCDNLPDNGALLCRGVLDFAQDVDSSLRRWIEEHVAFPGTMVDRITPASTPELTLELRCTLGIEDHAPIETEAFTQWVIEDSFAAGRPAWDQAGALLVGQVAPFEDMKLRMLNGSHSMLAYSGYLAGHVYVRDVMRDAALSRLVARHMAAAARTLKPAAGLDPQSYTDSLLARFRNPGIAHTTYQIAMDGSQKLPQRIFAPALQAATSGQPIEAFAFATAAWIRYLSGRHDDGRTYALQDPRESELSRAVAAGGTAEDIVARLCDVPALMPHALAESPQWRRAVSDVLARMVARGMPAAIADQAA